MPSSLPPAAKRATNADARSPVERDVFAEHEHPPLPVDVEKLQRAEPVAHPDLQLRERAGLALLLDLDDRSGLVGIGHDVRHDRAAPARIDVLLRRRAARLLLRQAARVLVQQVGLLAGPLRAHLREGRHHERVIDRARLIFGEPARRSVVRVRSA